MIKNDNYLIYQYSQHTAIANIFNTNKKNGSYY